MVILIHDADFMVAIETGQRILIVVESQMCFKLFDNRLFYPTLTLHITRSRPKQYGFMHNKPPPTTTTTNIEACLIACSLPTRTLLPLQPSLYSYIARASGANDSEHSNTPLVCDGPHSVKRDFYLPRPSNEQVV